MRVPRFPELLRKSYSLSTFLAEVPADARILNVGSENDRFRNAVNVDIRPGWDVDAQADAHHLPFRAESFDLVICMAALQYVEDPRAVVREFHRVLRPGGRVYVDVPFVQPYCRGTPDLWRFTLDGLKVLFRDWRVVRGGTSIPAGPAMAFYAQNICLSVPLHRVPKYALSWVGSLLAYPLTWLRLESPEVAGAFYLIAEKQP